MSRSSARHASSVVFVPVAAVGWVLVAMLGLAVRVALFPKNHTQGAVSVLWGLGFALYLWFGGWALGLSEGRAIPLALVAGTAIGLLIYLRGAGLESPPAAQPGRFYRRLLARYGSARGSRVPYQPHSSTKTRELVEARVALELGGFETALFDLRDAFRVAVAQRKLDELIEVRELVRALSARSEGRTKRASDRLAREVDAGLQTFPADALASFGIRCGARTRAACPLARRAGPARGARRSCAREDARTRFGKSRARQRRVRTGALRFAGRSSRGGGPAKAGRAARGQGARPNPLQAEQRADAHRELPTCEQGRLRLALVCPGRRRLVRQGVPPNTGTTERSTARLQRPRRMMIRWHATGGPVPPEGGPTVPDRVEGVGAHWDEIRRADGPAARVSVSRPGVGLDARSCGVDDRAVRGDLPTGTVTFLFTDVEGRRVFSTSSALRARASDYLCRRG